MKKCSYCGAEYPDHAVLCAIDHTPLDVPASSPKAGHSVIGIASFGISAAVGCSVVALLGVATVLSARRIPGERTYPGQRIVGFLIILLMAVDVVALALGIAALLERGKNRIFGTLGVIFSGLTIAGTIGLIIIGLMYLRLLR